MSEVAFRCYGRLLGEGSIPIHVDYRERANTLSPSQGSAERTRRLLKKVGGKEGGGSRLSAVHDAERYARQALAAYGTEHPNIPRLAHDVAYFWLERGRYTCAIPVFQAILSQFRHSSGNKIRIIANLARALAECGDVEAFRSNLVEFWSLSRKLDNHIASAFAFLQIAEGARALGDWMVAIEAAELSLAAAQKRREVDVVIRAEAILALSKSPEHAQCAPQEVLSDESDSSRQFAERLVQSLIVDRFVEELVSGARVIPGKCLVFPSPLRVAEAQHSSFIREQWAGRVVEYATFSRAVDRFEVHQWEQTLHFQLDGSPSFNRATRTDIVPPHVHDPSVPGGVRAALPDEIPARPW